MFANILLVPITAQLALGVYLKLHIHERTLRPWAVRAHGMVGKSYPVLGWTQLLFGSIVFRGYCRDGALGQCLAHYIMVRGLRQDPLCEGYRVKYAFSTVFMYI
jgi:hypothetical protein